MSPVRPIPEGTHTLTPYLIVESADQAIAFYKKAFGATELMRMPGPDGKSVMHAALQIGDSKVYLTDESPQWGTKSPKAYGGCSISLHLYVENADAAFKRAIDAGATEKMPVSEMFWGDRYGKLTDPFGYEWGIATQVRELTPEQMKKGAEEFFAQMSQQK